MILFPRKSNDLDLKALAHLILDEVKAGMPVSAQRIDWALRITGDLT